MVAGADAFGDPLGACGVVQHQFRSRPISHGRTALSLRETILDKTRVDAAGRDLTVAADAFSEEGRRSSIAIAEAVPGVRLVRDQTRIIDEAKPFTWSAERNVSRLTLSGNVSLPAVRARLNEAARGIAGGVEVADQMAFARGVPQRFEAAALLLMEQLGRLRDGKVTLSDTSVRLSGHRPRTRRSRGDRRRAQEPAGRLYGRRECGQRAALCLPGKQGSGGAER